MALVKWEPVPFRGMLDLRKEMDRLFEDFFGERRLPAFAEDIVFTPAVDLSETESDVIIKASMPGVDKKDLKITITGDTVTIKGESKRETEEKRKNYYRQEISYGTFTRTVALPAEVKADGAKANLKDGILEIVMPKTEKSKAKEITVSVD